MKTKSLNVLLKHKFFLYGMVFLSVLQLVNFYKAGSLTCLGAFGVAYYLGCMYTKNKAMCLLFANLVATFVLGCEKNLEGFIEGLHGQEHGECAVKPETGAGACNDDPNCEWVAGENGQPGSCGTRAPPPPQPDPCDTYSDENDCPSDRCSWVAGTNGQAGTCQDQQSS